MMRSRLAAKAESFSEARQMTKPKVQTKSKVQMTKYMNKS